MIKQYWLLSLKGILEKKRRSLLACIMICLGVFLINIYLVMSNCIVDIEAAKSEEKLDYKKIVIHPYKENGDEGINVYDLSEIKKIEGVESVSFSDVEYEENDKYRDNVETIVMNNIIFSRFRNQVNEEIRSFFDISVLYPQFDAYNLSKEKHIQRTDESFKTILAGRIPNSSKEYEVMIDNLTAKRFFGDIVGEEENYENVCGMEMEFTTQGNEKVVGNIVGIYNYRIVDEYKETITIEELEMQRSIEQYTYNEKELKEFEFTSIDICRKIYINETLAKKLFRDKEQNIGNRLELFKGYYGTIDVMIENIDDSDEVLNELEKYDYIVAAQIDLAKNVVNKFFFYKDVLAVVGVVISVMVGLLLVSIITVIVNERTEYARMLYSVGYSNFKIGNLLTMEIIHISFIGTTIALILCGLAGVIMESQIVHSLEESGLYRFVKITMNIGQVVMSYAVVLLICILLGKIISNRKLRKGGVGEG